MEIIPDASDQSESSRANLQNRIDENEILARKTTELVKGRCTAIQGIGLDIPLGEVELYSIGKMLEREALTALEETGSSTLYLALGLLQWSDPKGNTPILAPLFLYPIQISINRANRRVKIKLDNADPVGNVTLVEKIRQEYGIYLDVVVSPPEDESGFDITKALTQIRQIIANQPGWLVIDSCVITTFSFRQFLMWKDLQDNTDALLQNNLVKQVASGGLQPLEDPLGELNPDVLDQIPISDIPAVVSGDSSQLLAVYAALQGRSFVLQGPPGAGKSQTITNLIAAFLAKGKSVLFIAEKMAALEVVQRRLNGIGLGDFCLELHSSDVNRRTVIDSLMESFNQQRLSKIDASELLADLEEIKETLANYPIALHQKQSFGLSMYEIMGELEGLETMPTVSLPPSVIKNITPNQFKEMNQALEDYARRVELVEPISEHLWRFSNCSEWSLSLELEITNLLNQLTNYVSELDDKLSSCLKMMNNDSANRSNSENRWKPSWNVIKQISQLGTLFQNNLPECVYDQNSWGEYSQIAKKWLNISNTYFYGKEKLSKHWKDDIHELDLTSQIKTFEKLEKMFPLLRWIMQIIPRFSLRSIAKGKLPSNQQILKNLKEALEVKNLLLKIEGGKKEIDRLFNPYWQSDYNSLNELELLIQQGNNINNYTSQLHPQLSNKIELLVHQDDNFKNEYLSKITELNDLIHSFENDWRKFNQLMEASGDIISFQEDNFLAQTKTLLNKLRTAQKDFQNWCRYQKSVNNLEDNQLDSIIKAHHKGEIELNQLEQILRKSILYPWFVQYFDSLPILREFDGTKQKEFVTKFNLFYKEYLKLNQEIIKAELCQNLPSGKVIFEGSEIGILKRESQKQRGHIPIRALLQKIPNLLPKLKPCFLMSPASVAHFLPADGTPFDLVVFDEASQIETHNAIGALARGKQVVIVGDSKQMPPTSFFGGAGGGDTIIDENDIIEMESFLTEAIASQFPEQMLEWHYRSRHEMLIQFSNHNYYKGKLNIFPAAETKSSELGVKWHHITDGYYLKGAEKNNPLEATALVDYLVERLKTYQPQERSFGVITFSMPQKFLIDELLDEARQKYPEIEPHFSKEFDESVFVKNLENVQGDERDEILFSICYAPDKNGNFSVNFGPLNRQGGERRLNVAVTRAKESMHIFSSITGSQIDINRTNAIGALHLKEFLEFAEKSSRQSEDLFLKTNDFDSDIEKQIYQEIVNIGYTVNCKVGSGSYRVDLAVVHPQHPGIYVLGIETDGISYHQAPTVLDREGVRQVVLGLMKWNMYRIWSLDWKFRREEEISKLKQAIEKAIEQFDLTNTLSQNNSETIPNIDSSSILESEKIKQKNSQKTDYEPQFQLRTNDNQLPTTVSNFKRASTIGNTKEENGRFQNEQKITDVQELNKVEESQSTLLESSPLIPYVTANLEVVTDNKGLIYEKESKVLVIRKINQLIEVEAPILLNDMLRPIAQCWSYSSMSKKLKTYLTNTIKQLIKEGKLYLNDEFVWQSRFQCENWDKTRTNNDEYKRKIEQISIQELAVISEWIVQQSLSIDEEGLMKEVANILEFKQLNKSIKTRLQKTIKYMYEKGNVDHEKDRIFWKI
ncbi:DUF4011 domain-containing protein [Cyanobacterium sp. HL-69]|uniref:DUF4011 domain-containing protein n=1 Tax=Cyanobacterium sp. HL-69 TaxID=2054282 RepID=UPI00406BB7C3